MTPEDNAIIRLTQPSIVQRTGCSSFAGYTPGDLEKIVQHFRQKHGRDPRCIVCPTGTPLPPAVAHIPVFPGKTRFVLLGMAPSSPEEGQKEE